MKKIPPPHLLFAYICPPQAYIQLYNFSGLILESLFLCQRAIIRFEFLCYNVFAIQLLFVWLVLCYIDKETFSKDTIIKVPFSLYYQRTQKNGGSWNHTITCIPKIWSKKKSKEEKPRSCYGNFFSIYVVKISIWDEKTFNLEKRQWMATQRKINSSFFWGS